MRFQSTPKARGRQAQSKAAPNPFRRKIVIALEKSISFLHTEASLSIRRINTL
jgi:hypothetical protein